MGVDPFLYVSLGVGFLVGRAVPYRGSWLTRATSATVVGLVFFLGASLGKVPLATLADTIPPALLFAGLVLGLTIGIDQLLRRGRPSTSVPVVQRDPGHRPNLRFPAILLGALLAGLVLGRLVVAGADVALSGTLYLLLGLVGYDLDLKRVSIRGVATPLTAAFAGAIAGASIAILLLGLPARVGLATALGLGWYTLAGPVVARAAGPALGLLAFLTNFLRENLTMIVAPWAGPRWGGSGLIAMGGATSMDTTLPFVTQYGGREFALPALSSGLALTVAASLLLPLVLGLGVG